MSLLCFAVVHLREQAALRETATQFAQSTLEDRASAIRAIHQAGVNGELFAALAASLGKGIILAALALCISSFATSNIFTISAMAMIYLVGHLEAVAREYWLQQHSAGWFTRAFLAVVAFIFPDPQAFNLSDQLIAGAILTGTLLVKLFELGLVYTVAYLLLAIAIFYQREL